jgi:hypothetical protein
MKTIQHTILAALFGVFLMSNSIVVAQEKKEKEKEKELLITVTKLHWNMNLDNFKMDEWKAIEKEYLDKVIKKNDFILEQEFLLHYFTEDNTEILFVTAYDSWDAIEKADKKSMELEKLAWPDEKVRKAFFEKRAAYYAHNHSDEIYASYVGAKLPKAKMDKPVLFYVRKSHFAYPKDGTQKEFDELRNKYLEEVTFKNDFIKAYYPNVHAWGANNTEFTEVFVVETLGDIEKAFDKDAELFKAAWTDEAKRKDFDKKMEKYFTGVHGDYIYRLVPELVK